MQVRVQRLRTGLATAFAAGLVALLAGCTTVPRTAPPPGALSAIEASLRTHIDILASDEFGGRRPGTDGEGKTLRYLAREFQGMGLESGTNDPSNPWYAPVELASITPAQSSARFFRSGRPVAMPGGGVAVFSAGSRGLIDRAPVMFVGNAGERLDGAAVAGRVVLMLWDHEGHTEQRDALLREGAAAVIAIVRDEDEYASMVAARRRGSYRLASVDGGNAIDGFMTLDAAAALIGEARFADLLAHAQDPAAKPRGIDAVATLEATSTPGTVKTHNLIARLPGRVPGSGAVLVLAHWDHFGTCAAPPAIDTTCNGAVDNASGLAVMTELARRLAAGPRPARDVYFLATTAEEWGLLGAQAFAENPPVPLDSIVAAFNLDTVAVAPAGGPVAIVGKGLTPLDPGILSVLKATGRVEGTEEYASAYVRRQDGWALIQRDVPAVSVTSAFAQEGPLARYITERYHQPADKPTGIELGGAAEDLLLNLALVRFFADPAKWTATAGKSVAAP
ncbi:M28 family metallopeptidase [Tsuneonella amylolytica]|uniref:M28 family metallopeptidase n=1 Tax=Tsuneonella amylolytica TaxID=2338327 RepID=UPI000EA89948|nr:M20/M25/M40 family metallo-hydrolase [Tsuneonella amylolytica]